MVFQQRPRFRGKKVCLRAHSFYVLRLFVEIMNLIQRLKYKNLSRYAHTRVSLTIFIILE
ncbi:hypothetical protein ALT1545_220054 [Alteromonas macleodii]|uniref:Uncharacterized protein n=1 Tax=marine metagenome TaxID=408172 RepID=A0A382B0H3_9ZZZZ